jgi:DNA-binding GntR family transcriptional regulator
MQPSKFLEAGQTLTESIRLSVIRDLSSGVLRPGQPIDERALAEQFEVSRTPIREAILQLAAQGFVIVGPRTGASVPKLSIHLLRELLELLGELEATAAKFAARRMRPAEKQELQQVLADCVDATKTNDPIAYDAANTRFHDLIYHAARNNSLVDQIQRLRTRSAGYTVDRFEAPGRMSRSLQDHAAIAAALLRGEPEQAHAAMLEHISIGGRDFAEFVSGLPQELLRD